MGAGPIRIAILANGSQARAEAAATARAYGVMGKSVSRLGKVMLGAFAIGGLVRMGAAVGRVGSQYVDSLNKIQALTDASDAQMQRIATRLESQSAAFARFGQTTGDAAQGMVELTKSGLSADKALGAIRGTMLLAKAGELEVADASELVANTLNTFSLKATKASSIANSLANAANLSSANVSDLAESFKYVAPLSAKAGVSVDQTNAILAELANSGIKASQAGTSLRTFLLNLQAPSAAGAKALRGLNVEVYDAEGNMRPLPALIGDLNRGLGKMSDAGQNAKLKDIFGKIGITGAQVILKNGTKGLAEYTAGVKRAGAATKLAASASKGLAGTWDSLKAQATSTVQELYRRFSPALDARLQSVSNYLAANKDEMINAGIAAATKLGPALQAIGELAKSAGPALLTMGKAAGEILVPALTAVAKVTTVVVNAFNSLPGPVKSMAVQAGIAALVFPRLAAGITAATTSMKNGIIYTRVLAAEMQTTATRGKLVATTMAKIGSAARGAAGVGGMVLLAQSTSQTNAKLGLLEKTAGGALLGFSVAGPWGAAVGAGAGALWGLADAAGGAWDAMKAGIKMQADYRTSLDQTTAAITQATRALVFQNLQQNDTLTVTRALGIADRDAVGYILGRKAAIERVSTAVKQATGTAKELRGANSEAFYFNKQSAGDFLNALRLGKQSLTAEQKALLDQIQSTKTWGQALKGIPKNVQSKVIALGAKATAIDVARLVSRYKELQKRGRIQTIIKALGTTATVQDVRRVLKAFNDLGKTKPDLSPALRKVQQFSAQAKREAIEGGTGVADGLKRGTGKARADLTQFQRTLTSGINKAKTSSSSGGRQAGNALGQGIYSGVDAWAGPIASRAAAIVRAAVAAAKAAGKIKSPSRVMRDEVGVMLGRGLVEGVDSQGAAAEQAGKSLTEKLVRGAMGGLDGIRGVLDRLRAYMEKTQEQALDAIEKAHEKTWAAIEKDLRKRFKGKELERQLKERKRALDKKLAAEKKAWRQHAQAVNAVIRSQRTAMLANGKAQDLNTAKLEKAIGKYKDLVGQANDFAKGIRDGFKSFGSIVGLGQQEDGTVSLPELVKQLKQRAAQSLAFVKAINSLRGRLNDTSLQQLLEQAASGDIAGALATAQAIASGGQSAIDEINALTAQMAAIGDGLANRMRDDFYGVGIQAAQGIIDGLKAQQKELDKIAEALAKALVDKIKKMLGIKSPSRVFREIGDQSVAGLVLSFKANESHVRRVGANAAAALVDGFGSPVLATPAVDAWNKASSLNGSAKAAGVEGLLVSIQAELVKLNATETAAPAAAGRAFADHLNARAANKSRTG